LKCWTWGLEKNKIIKTFKKHIVLSFLLLLFVPTAIESIHAFEIHEHSGCTSKTEKHIHEQTIDCSAFHLQLSPLTYAFVYTKTVILKEFYTSKFINDKPTFTIVYKSKKSVRGPPCFIV
jgi:hypothetical protein